MATTTDVRTRQEQSAIAAGQPARPPDPYKEAEKHREVAQQRKEITRKLRDFDKLNAREQFETVQEAQDLGIIKETIIPEGARFIRGADIDWSKSGLSKQQIAAIETGMHQRTGVLPKSGYITKEQADELDKWQKEQAQIRIANQQELEEFESSHTQLKDGKWIDNQQLSDIEKSSPKMYRALISGGFAAADKLIKEQQEAISTLKPYQRWTETSPGLVNKLVEQGKAPYGYDVALFLRDNPKEKKVLESAGYTPAQVRRIDRAVKATESYWTDDNKLNAYAAYVGGISPRDIKTLTGLDEKELKGLPPPLLAFLESYKISNPPPVSKEPWYLAPYSQRIDRYNKWEGEAAKVYDKLYGKGQAALAGLREYSTAIFAPAAVLEPTRELKDITPLEWVIGVGQVALYTMPFWLPSVAKPISSALRPLRKVERLARTAGNARLNVNIAKAEMFARDMAAPEYTRFASNAQQAIQTSMRADRAFLDKLALLSKLKPNELRRIEQLSGIRGLAGSIDDVEQARQAVLRAWDSIELSKWYVKPTTQLESAANQVYLTKLNVLRTAQNNLANVLAKASGKTTPVYQLSPSASWPNIINATEREIASLRKEMAKAELSMQRANLPTTKEGARQYWLEIKGQLEYAEARLKNYQQASAAGQLPPDVARYIVTNKTPTQAAIESFDKTLKQVDDWLKGQGDYAPQISPESLAGVGRVATAVRQEKIAIPKVTPKTKLEPSFADVATKGKVVTPKVETGADLLRTAGKIGIVTPKEADIIPIEDFGRMTAEQIRRRYGEQLAIDAVSPYVIPYDLSKPREWLSPSEAVKRVQQIAVKSYVRQITNTAAKQANEMKAANATQAQIATAIKQSMQAQIATAVIPALQPQVRQALRPKEIIETIIKTPPVTPPPQPPTSPPPTIVLPIMLKDGSKQLKELTRKERKSATSWPQGFGYWVVFQRNNRKYAFFIYGQKAPAGIKQVQQGKGEAYRGIQTYKGKPQGRFNLPMGVVTAEVGEPEREPGKVGAISFTARRPRITPKRPRIS